MKLRRTDYLILACLVCALTLSPNDAGSQTSRNPYPAADKPLPCIRHYESRGNYRAVSRNGKYRGAYQFSRPTWDSNAKAGPHTDWVGVDPAKAPEDIQDSQARVLVQRRGLQPWPTPNKKCR